MTTIPARLAKTTISSGSWPVAQARARSLYRAWYRSAPEIVTLYAANIPATAIRAKIRQRYERNKYVDDLQAVDVLLAKSQMDYQETLNAWKMDSHLMRMFNDEEIPPQPVAFLDKFYYSRDDPEAVQPAA